MESDRGKETEGIEEMKKKILQPCGGLAGQQPEQKEND